MEIREIADEKYTIIILDGNLLGETDAKPVLAIAQEAFDKQNPNLIVDENLLKYINSTGLSVFVQLHTHAQANGGALCLIGVQDQFKNILEITKLDMIFKICKTIEEAKDNFFK